MIKRKIKPTSEKLKKLVIMLLNAPSKKEYKEEYDKIEDDFWKGQWKNYYDDVLQLVETETMLHNYASVVELGWKPEHINRPFALKDNKLQGHYILKVKKPGTEEPVNVISSSDWVEKNFSTKVSATAQKAFFSYYEKVPVKPREDRKKVEYETGFVDVAM